MTSLEPTSSFNVEASLNDWLAAALASYTRPSWLATMPSIRYDWDDLALSAPCFSLFHLPVGLDTNAYQGRQVGGGKRGAPALGILDLSCWVTKTANPNWMAQLRTMRDMAQHAVLAKTVVIVRDYAAPALPVNTAYKVDIGDFSPGALEADSRNPAVWRARCLIEYRWTYRVT